MLSQLVLVLSIISAAQMSTPECGCIRRPTFDQEWLVENYPAVATANSGYTFSAPVVTYPDCAACITTCPTGQLVANLDFKSGALTIGGSRFPNPTSLLDLLCEGHVWYNSGLGSEMDSNFNSSTLGCALKK